MIDISIEHRSVPREARRAARRALEALTQDGTPNGICGRPAVKAAGVGFGPTGRRNFYANDGNLSWAFKRDRSEVGKVGP
jgi:hypothetical protein